MLLMATPRSAVEDRLLFTSSVRAAVRSNKGVTEYERFRAGNRDFRDSSTAKPSDARQRPCFRAVGKMTPRAPARLR